MNMPTTVNLTKLNRDHHSHCIIRSESPLCIYKYIKIPEDQCLMIFNGAGYGNMKASVTNSDNYAF